MRAASTACLRASLGELRALVARAERSPALIADTASLPDPGDCADPGRLAGASAVPASEIEGHWNGDFGHLVLRRVGDEIWGAYEHDDGTVRGRLVELSAEDRAAALDRFSEVLLPGRTAEVRVSTRKELAATLAMALPIEPGGWLLKVAADGPATPEEAGAEPDVWSGVVPVRTVLGTPVPAPGAEHLPVPASVVNLRRQPPRH